MNEQNRISDEIHQFQLRPKNHKFNVERAKEILKEELCEQLSGKSFKEEAYHDYCSALANNIKMKCRHEINLTNGGNLDAEPYKFVCQVIMTKKDGAGLRFNGRCRWDVETDISASYTYENDTLLCVAALFIVYAYE